MKKALLHFLLLLLSLSLYLPTYAQSGSTDCVDQIASNLGFKWWIPQRWRIYATGATEVDVYLPFDFNYHPFSDAPSQDSKDMYPCDGWMLVYKDFGTSSQQAPEYPSFALYNKYRGILRVMFYLPNGRAVNGVTGWIAKLALINNTKAALFTFSDNQKPYVDDPNYQFELSVPAIAYGSEGTWSSADFLLIGYDQKLFTQPNARFLVKLKSQNLVRHNTKWKYQPKRSYR